MKKFTEISENVISNYKDSDPIMVRKCITLKDVGFRKDEPSRELWHAEMSLDHDFYLATLVVAGAAIILSYGICRVAKSVKCRRKYKR